MIYSQTVTPAGTRDSSQDFETNLGTFDLSLSAFWTTQIQALERTGKWSPMCPPKSKSTRKPDLNPTFEHLKGLQPVRRSSLPQPWICNLQSLNWLSVGPGSSWGSTKTPPEQWSTPTTSMVSALFAIEFGTDRWRIISEINLKYLHEQLACFEDPFLLPWFKCSIRSELSTTDASCFVPIH